MDRVRGNAPADLVDSMAIQMNITTVAVLVILGLITGCTTSPPKDTRIVCYKVPPGVSSYGRESGFSTEQTHYCRSIPRR
jgi:hypothetical protein